MQALTTRPLYAESPVNNVSPTWSPDGQHIAFLSDRSGRWEVHVMNPDGSDQKKMFESALDKLAIGLRVREREEHFLGSLMAAFNRSIVGGPTLMMCQWTPHKRGERGP